VSSDSHVEPRDGHWNLGGPRPAVTSRAPKPKPAAQAADARYSDPSTVGWYDERKTFEAAHGRRSPRQRLAAGEGVDGKVDRIAPAGTHQEPGDPIAYAPAPLT
jgi:hypothetical protein